MIRAIRCNHGVSQQPHAWTFGRAGVPYYCGHTALWFDMLPPSGANRMMKTSYGDFDAQGRVVGTPCMTFIHKQIPAGK